MPQFKTLCADGAQLAGYSYTLCPYKGRATQHGVYVVHSCMRPNTRPGLPLAWLLTTQNPILSLAVVTSPCVRQSRAQRDMYSATMWLSYQGFVTATRWHSKPSLDSALPTQFVFLGSGEVLHLLTLHTRDIGRFSMAPRSPGASLPTRSPRTPHRLPIRAFPALPLSFSIFGVQKKSKMNSGSLQLHCRVSA
jgi:hypothetical protein